MPIQSKQQPPYYTTGINVQSYIALLSQTGINAPVATVLQNTLDGTIVWTRNDIGDYRGTLSNAFPSNKTWAMINFNPDASTNVGIGVSRLTDSVIIVTTADFPDTLADERLNNTPIEIRIYNT